MANLADVVGTAAGIALAKFNLPVLPTFCLLSLGYLYSSRCALVALRLAHVAVLCRFHPLPGLAGLPLLPGGNWMLQVAARWMLGGDVASLAPTSGTPGLGARVHRMSCQRTYSPPCPLCLCRREVDSVVLPYLNRARLSYTARAFLSTGACSALTCSLAGLLACLPAVTKRARSRRLSVHTPPELVLRELRLVEGTTGIPRRQHGKLDS